MFKQKIENGYQVETPDNWLKDGNPFELRRDEYAKEVRFGGTIRVEYDEKTKPVLDYYRQQGCLHPICGVGKIEEIFDRICKELDSLS